MKAVLTTIVAVFVFAILAPMAHADPVNGTIQCKGSTIAVDRAEVTLEKNGQSVRIELFSRGKSRHSAALDISLRESTGKVDVSQVAFYHLYAKCPETQYNVNRSVGEGSGDHDDFGKFVAELKRGGSVQLKVSGKEEMFDDLTWNIELSEQID